MDPQNLWVESVISKTDEFLILFSKPDSKMKWTLWSVSVESQLRYIR